jgi:hypothetical protein
MKRLIINVILGSLLGVDEEESLSAWRTPILCSERLFSFSLCPKEVNNECRDRSLDLSEKGTDLKVCPYTIEA